MIMYFHKDKFIQYHVIINTTIISNITNNYVNQKLKCTYIKCTLEFVIITTNYIFYILHSNVTSKYI